MSLAAGLSLESLPAVEGTDAVTKIGTAELQGFPRGRETLSA
jgi:hypothetical protein